MDSEKSTKLCKEKSDLSFQSLLKNPVGKVYELTRLTKKLLLISVEESLSRHGKTARKSVIFFLQFQIKNYSFHILFWHFLEKMYF